MSSYTFKLPKQDGSSEEHTVEHNSVVVIGANGSGKTMLGEWIERQSLEKVHRIGAQRSLNFKKVADMRTNEQAENLFLYGETKKAPNKTSRWGRENSSRTLTLLTDYDFVLSAVFAQVSKENADFMDKCKICEAEGKTLPQKTPELITQKIIKIWNAVFSHLSISLKDGIVTATNVS